MGHAFIKLMVLIKLKKIHPIFFEKIICSYFEKKGHFK